MFQQPFIFFVVDVVCLHVQFQRSAVGGKGIGKMQFAFLRLILGSIVEYIELRRGNLHDSFPIGQTLINDFLIQLADIEQAAQRHILIDSALMLQQDDVLIPEPERDIILQVIEKCSLQRRDPNILGTGVIRSFQGIIQ